MNRVADLVLRDRDGGNTAKLRLSSGEDLPRVGDVLVWPDRSDPEARKFRRYRVSNVYRTIDTDPFVTDDGEVWVEYGSVEVYAEAPGAFDS